MQPSQKQKNGTEVTYVLCGDNSMDNSDAEKQAPMQPIDDAEHANSASILQQRHATTQNFSDANSASRLKRCRNFHNNISWWVLRWCRGFQRMMLTSSLRLNRRCKRQWRKQIWANGRTSEDAQMGQRKTNTSRCHRSSYGSHDSVHMTETTDVTCRPMAPNYDDIPKNRGSDAMYKNEEEI